MSYKYSGGNRFITKNGKVGTIIRIAKIDGYMNPVGLPVSSGSTYGQALQGSTEFGADFYFEEKNYVVVFDEGNTSPIASYNFIAEFSPIKYNYVMTENDIKEVIQLENNTNSHGN
jgi:hypothetical protein